MNVGNGTVIPVNLAEGRFIYFTADNTDINEGTLHGQNTFRATQYTEWQRGPESVGVLQNIASIKRATLKVPDEVNTILPALIREGTAETAVQGRRQRGMVQAINPGLSISFEGSRNEYNIFP